jgi:hypothetical protein
MYLSGLSLAPTEGVGNSNLTVRSTQRLTTCRGDTEVKGKVTCWGCDGINPF